MRFLQMNGLGNTFAVFDARADGGLALSADQVRAIAEGQAGGAGADQVIVIEPSARADAFMRIWNRDGGEVEACGNAARCVAWLLMRESGAGEASLETVAGLLGAGMRGVFEVAVDMGVPRLKWEDIPLAERMDTRGIDIKVGPIDAPVLAMPGAVNMGNPHCVFFVPDVAAVAVETIGPMIENHPLFPQRANVGFAQILAPDHIRLRVWERGAGLTRACGTGACAAVVAAHRRGLGGRGVGEPARRGLVERRCSVTLDGGDLSIEWRASDDRVIMIGPIELEAEQELASAPG